MVRPEEFVIIENDESEIVCEFVKESDTIQLHRTSRECLFYLIHPDAVDLESFMPDKMIRQVDMSENVLDDLRKWSLHLEEEARALQLQNRGFYETNRLVREQDRIWGELSEAPCQMCNARHLPLRASRIEIVSFRGGTKCQRERSRDSQAKFPHL